MKLVTYNVYVESPAEGIQTDIQNLITAEDPDFICLQEYSPHHQLDQILLEQGYNFVTFEYYRSKHKALHLLTAYKRAEPERKVWVSALNDYFPGKREGKGIMGCNFKFGDHYVIVVNVHFPIWNITKNKLAVMSEIITEQMIPGSQVLICGDFNTIKNRTGYLEDYMEKIGFNVVSPRVETYKAGKIRRKIFGELQLDWVFTNLHSNLVKKSEIIENAIGSDHYPVVVEFTRRQ